MLGDFTIDVAGLRRYQSDAPKLPDDEYIQFNLSPSCVPESDMGIQSVI